MGFVIGFWVVAYVYLAWLIVVLRCLMVCLNTICTGNERKKRSKTSFFLFVLESPNQMKNEKSRNSELLDPYEART